MKIVILGAGGRLGAALMREYREKYDIAGFDHAELDLESLGDVRGKLGAMNFDMLLNAAPSRPPAPRITIFICSER